jgi:uncharacterized protein DUF4185
VFRKQTAPGRRQTFVRRPPDDPSSTKAGRELDRRVARAGVRRWHARLALAVACVAQVSACRSTGGSPEAWRAETWPDADRLFRQDSRWLGGDAAYSIALGNHRTLWLFGDSWIARGPNASRSDAALVRNSVAVQLGDDPTQAAMTFYWGSERGQPKAFVEASGDEWLWPAQGARVGDRLVVFFDRMRPSGREGMWNFESFGTAALVVENPDAQPPAWRARLHEVATPPGVVLSGGAAVDGDRLLVFGTSEPSHRVCVASFPLDAIREGDLSRPQWWSGAKGWVDASGLDGAPATILDDAQTEFTVHRDDASGSWILVSTEGFGAASVALRFAADPRGPWSAPRIVYRPPEADVKDAMVYAAKAHPELRGAGVDLALTYATNSFDFAKMVNDPSLYYPRFVRLRRR